MNILRLLISGLLGILLSACHPVSIEADTYETRPHFRIKTRTATYYLDQAGGGLSRVLDADGTDWVQYKGPAQTTAPEGAAGGFRGIPNLVFGSTDGGAGHPGFDQCISEPVDGSTIRTRSKSGKWAWTWQFFDDHARLRVDQVDTARSYWFLYEGPVAGRFRPDQQYWGTDLGGPRSEAPSLNHGESIVDHWQWAYFGDQDADRIFFVAQQPADTLNDFFAYMGNTREGTDAADGMVVFGFGRDRGTRSLMAAPDITFIIGFLDRKIVTAEDHQWAAEQIRRIIRE